MAGKRKEQDSGKRSEDFSILFGKRAVEDAADSGKDAEAPPQEKGGEPQQKELKEPAEKPPARKPPETLPELLKKKAGIELFLDSMEHARKNSKFPEYTYDKLKKKGEFDLKRISGQIMKMGGAAGAGGDAKCSKDILSEIGSLLRMEEETGSLKAGMARLAERIGKMESSLEGVARLRPQLEVLKEAIREYRSLLEEVGSREKSMARDMAGIRKALSCLREDLTRIREEGKAGRPVESTLEGVMARVESFSKKMDAMCKTLSDRIDEVSVAEEVEILDHVNRLKRHIDSMRSGMSGYVKRQDLEHILLKPIVKMAAAPVKRKPAARKKGNVDVEDLSDFVGKEVTVECDVALFKSAGSGPEGRLYWYRIRDASGEGVLTAYARIKDGKARIRGEVKQTNNGSVYLFFKGAA